MDTATANGRLLSRGSAPLPVLVCDGTALSLHVELITPTPPAFGAVFDGLQVDTPHGPLELSRCRLDHDQSATGGRLVFLDDLYDCRALVAEGRLSSFNAQFDKLPLVLSQKLTIQPAFRIYVSDLIYDLNVWRKFFNEQDRMISSEPPEVARIAQQQLLDTRGPAFFQFFDAQLARLDALVAGFSRAEHEQHGYYFRQQVWSFIIGAEFMKRTNLKPRGYAGDFEMMQMIYDDAWVGRYVFNKLMHRHPLSVPAAQAVRNRRALIPSHFQLALAQFPDRGSREARLMSLACGPARELIELFGVIEPDRLHVTLLDQDPSALKAASETVEQIEQATNRRLRVDYINESVRTLLRTRDLGQRLGTFHFIYSMGLFDYLTPPVAKAVLLRIYGLLEPGGTLVVGNYHARNPNRHYMAYWLDWSLYYRSEEEFLSLAEGLPGATATVALDRSGCQMFLTLTRG